MGNRTETVLAALKIAHEAGVTTIFNPAPAHSEIPAELYAYIDILAPTRARPRRWPGMPVTSIEQATAAAQMLLRRGPRTIILTFG